MEQATKPEPPLRDVSEDAIKALEEVHRKAKRGEPSERIAKTVEIYLSFLRALRRG